MNLKEIQEVIRLMDENGITEFVMEKNGFKICLKRGMDLQNQTVVSQVMAPASVSSVSSSKNQPEHHVPVPPVDDGLNDVVAPMVGTFYSASSPDADPFVKPGQTIKQGDVLCIIEAMKVMNEIKAETSGTIVDILVENGEPVEFGQALFKIKP